MKNICPKQIQEQRLHELEADVDDTVNFQVYGNMEPQKAATEAVRETEGQILCQNGEAVEEDIIFPHRQV